MKITPIEFTDKAGRKVILRSADEDDAAALIEYLKTTTAETPFLIREPDEVKLTIEQEKEFIRRNLEAERELLLIAEIDKKHVGNCSLMQIGNYRRYSHRCDVAIALYQEFCGFGIGRKMLETVLDIARNCGYEQAELEVMSSNKTAISLYETMGFNKYGIFPDNMKYGDGTYDDAFWMMRKL